MPLWTSSSLRYGPSSAGGFRPARMGESLECLVKTRNPGRQGGGTVTNPKARQESINPRRPIANSNKSIPSNALDGAQLDSGQLLLSHTPLLPGAELQRREKVEHLSLRALEWVWKEMLIAMETRVTCYCE